MNTDRKLRNRLLSAVPIAALAFSLAACGGAAVERPSAEEVAEGWTKIIDDAGQSDLYTDDIILCLSEALVDSEISDEDLANIADGKDIQTSTDAQELLTQVVTEAAPKCATPAE
ncbi:putative small lipoprotein YifL [Microbacterium sp. ZKA21]|jgi:hypothetical protein|uniref:hypothetical protein n=1 Tax=Microbacterium sp. ZKA21 TaxID=3381694 RepID=UPI003D24547E